MKYITRMAILLAAIGLVSCASPVPPKVVMQELAPEEIVTMTALDARFEEVSFKGVPVVTALILIQRADRAWHQKIPRFMFAIDGGSAAAKDGQARNPKISMEMRNVTLAAVLNEVCRQTGWVMEPKHGGQRVDFYPTGRYPVSNFHAPKTD